MRFIAVTGTFEAFDCRQVRLLQEASRLGRVIALAWSDRSIQGLAGRPCQFPQQERQYVLERIRYVHAAAVVDIADPHQLPGVEGLRPDAWAVTQAEDHPLKREFCSQKRMELIVIPDDRLAGLPLPPLDVAGTRPKVVVTGCYDWLHSGHVRFFEEASTYGQLYVIVGNDANVRRLKGPGHPLFSQEQRQYLVSAVRFVSQALISTGSGWLDADPQIRAIKPDVYLVNEDGDKGGKRQYCHQLGIRYIVLRREPAPGLPRRTSTELRGF